MFFSLQQDLVFITTTGSAITDASPACSWQKRGHISLNDISATSFDIGNVSDAEIMASFALLTTPIWPPSMKCKKSYERTSWGIEGAGVVNVFIVVFPPEAFVTQSTGGS
jgi:hypothetical protein